MILYSKQLVHDIMIKLFLFSFYFHRFCQNQISDFNETASLGYMTFSTTC